ncbi:MAG: LCP family protein [Lachnospiraceae bacterium]|nr:LCP family protein [Lachnospiraceae bacterium]
MNKEKKKRFTIGICLLICVILLAGVILTLALIGAGKREKKEAASEPETTEAPQIPEQHYFDFLMFGIDDEGYTPWDIDKSDMIMLVSVNEDTKQINLISILRDTKVPIEGVGNKKINVAYAAGRAPLAIQTVNNTYHLNIDKFITFNWQDIVFLIDDIGGVDVEITADEAEQVNRMVAGLDISQEGRNTWSEDVWEGLMHLDGTQATHFSRIRKIDSDYYRALRQQRTLRAIQQKVLTMSADEYPWLAQILLENTVETNLSVSDVMEWMQKDVVHYEITSNVIPDRAIDKDVYGGQDDELNDWAWIYDLEAASDRIHSILGH